MVGSGWEEGERRVDELLSACSSSPHSDGQVTVYKEVGLHPYYAAPASARLHHDKTTHTPHLLPPLPDCPSRVMASTSRSNPSSSSSTTAPPTATAASEESNRSVPSPPPSPSQLTTLPAQRGPKSRNGRRFTSTPSNPSPLPSGTSERRD